MTKGAPFRVTALLWLVLWFTVWNAIRLWTAVSWRARLEEFAPRPGPLYIGLTGAVFAACGLAVLWSLLKGKPWTRSLLPVTALVYSAWYWFDRLVFQRKPANWLFVLVVNVLVFVFVLIALRSWYLWREAYAGNPQD